MPDELNSTEVELIAKVRTALWDWGLGDIYKALGKKLGTDKIEPGTEFDPDKAALRGAFILCCSLLDAISCYRYGKESDPASFGKLLTEYLPHYKQTKDDNDLWYSLRCGLIHSYQTKNTSSKRRSEVEFALTHENPDLHLTLEGERIVVNLENLVADVEKTLTTILNEFEQPGSDALYKLKKWSQTSGVFSVPEPEGTELPATTFTALASAVYYRYQSD